MYDSKAKTHIHFTGKDVIKTDLSSYLYTDRYKPEGTYSFLGQLKASLDQTLFLTNKKISEPFLAAAIVTWNLKQKLVLQKMAFYTYVTFNRDFLPAARLPKTSGPVSIPKA